MASTLDMVLCALLVGPLDIGRCRKIVEGVDKRIPSGSIPLGDVLFLFGVGTRLFLLGVDDVGSFFLVPFLPPPAFADLRALCLFPIVANSFCLSLPVLSLPVDSSSIVSSSISSSWSSLPVSTLPVSIVSSSIGCLFQYCLFQYCLFRLSLPVSSG